VLIDGTFALSNYDIALTEGDLPRVPVSINGFNGGDELQGTSTGDNEIGTVWSSSA
jgi:hypothetical protein